MFKNSQISKENVLCSSLFLIKLNAGWPATLLQSDSSKGIFCKIYGIIVIFSNFIEHCFTEHLRLLLLSHYIAFSSGALMENHYSV